MVAAVGRLYQHMVSPLTPRRVRQPLRAFALIAVGLSTVFGHAAAADAREYPLDDISRHLSGPRKGSRVVCPEVELRTYRGTNVRFHKSMNTNVNLVPRIAEFEALVDELAVKYYGREPRRIVHIGSYNCRASRGRRPRLSEHALGNAIDISAFRFGRAPHKSRANLAPQLRRPFTVSVLRHWDDGSVHACFLRELVSEIMQRKIFRSVIGPGNPKHDNHFHLDMSPWTVRQIDMDGTQAMCGFAPPAPRWRRSLFDWFR